MEIRFAKQSDIPGILNLLKQVVMVHHNIRPDIFKTETKYNKEELEQMIDSGDMKIIVAEKDDTIQGYSFYIIKEEPEESRSYAYKTCYIDDLCVDESLRCKHIGKQLYEKVYEIAKENNCNSVTLNVWDDNTPAKKFYQSVGMTPQKTIMEKRLM